MKTTTLLAAILAATSALRATAAQKPVLPEFQSPEQLVQWRRETMEKARAADTQAAAAPATFYTGKPYLEETGSYAFKYRQYDPELARWTTFDPSGFPDGANGIAYMPVPTSEFDWQGLQVATISVGERWFNINFKLSYDKNAEPTLVGDPWIGGIAGISGIPAGYEISIAGGILSGITKIDLPGGTWKYTGKFDATVILRVVAGAKAGPVEIGVVHTSSLAIATNWEVFE